MEHLFDSTDEPMCLRCEATITEGFYCINCGYVPPRFQAEKRLESEIQISLVGRLQQSANDPQS